MKIKGTFLLTYSSLTQNFKTVKSQLSLTIMRFKLVFVSISQVYVCTYLSSLLDWGFSDRIGALDTFFSSVVVGFPNVRKALSRVRT